jgi:hypothetical protein
MMFRGISKGPDCWMKNNSVEHVNSILGPVDEMSESNGTQLRAHVVDFELTTLEPLGSVLACVGEA